MDLAEYERLEPHMSVTYAGRELRFTTPNQRAAARVQTLFTKEPDTVAWIDGFGEADVLVDIGANVGMYSILAAARGARVYAFEPESQNYALLNRNIHLNGMDERISAYALALADRAGYSTLFLSEFAAAGSCHNFGEAIDFRYQPMQAAFRQGCVASTLDALVAEGVLPAPTCIKIDVDGIEPKVIAGARATLEASGVHSLLVELNTNLDDHWEVVDQLLALGFDYSTDAADAARRTEGRFSGVGNFLFRR